MTSELKADKKRRELTNDHNDEDAEDERNFTAYIAHQLIRSEKGNFNSMVFFSQLALNSIISYHKLCFLYIYSTIIGWLVILVIKLSSEILRFGIFDVVCCVCFLVYGCLFKCGCVCLLTQPNGVCKQCTPLIT